MSEATKTPEKTKVDPIKKKPDIKKDKSNDTAITEKISADHRQEKKPPLTEASSSAQSEKGKYVRGENQNPVTKAYRNNWNKILAKPEKK